MKFELTQKEFCRVMDLTDRIIDFAAWILDGGSADNNEDSKQNARMGFRRLAELVKDGIESIEIIEEGEDESENDKEEPDGIEG